MRATLLVALVCLVVQAGCRDKKAPIHPEETPSPSATQGQITPDPVPVPVDPKYTINCGTEKPGPVMVEVTSPEGKTYCIDTTEVTQSQYAVFLQKAEKSALSPPDNCKDVKIEAPQPPTDDHSSSLCSKAYDPTKTPNAPMMCIDWCQAQAYCQWAGKRLCGQIGGGATSNQSALVASSDEWYSACSNQGKTSFPYGESLQPGTCYDREKVEKDHPGYDFYQNSKGDWLPDTSKQAGCHGQDGALRYVYDLAGSVSEWGSYCPTPYGCSIRGGAAISFDSDVSCSYFETTLNTPSGTIGFRCCGDTVSP